MGFRPKRLHRRSALDWVFEESVVIPLDPAGDPVLAFDTDVPPGTYKELEVSIDKLEIGNPAEDPLIAQYPASRLPWCVDRASGAGRGEIVKR